MNHRKVLIVDDEPSTIDLIIATLEDAGCAHVIAGDHQKALQTLQDEPVSIVLARGFGSKIRAADLCREIRQTQSSEKLPVLVMLKEDQLVGGAEALVAGATDLLIEPFEPRELRMRAGIVPMDQRKRVDQAHTLATEMPELVGEPKLHVPEFDPVTKRFHFGPFEGYQQQWENDPDTAKVTLDKIIVCPHCDAVPTIRPGCGACGSAWIEQEVLLHHYACAHVGPESEFRGPSGLVCPKCRLTDLVAGSDFEQTAGCSRCTDCDAIFTEAKMIGHCLSCQHRFSISDAKVVELYGYQVGASVNSAVIPPPNYQTAAGVVTPSTEPQTCQN